MKLNVGSGMEAQEGWVNIDVRPAPGVDVICDAEHLPFPDECFDQILMSHVIEHLPDHMAVMEELWRVSADSTTAEVRCPHGSSDLAFDDPDHIRQLHVGFWKYLAQPTYWRNSFLYGYGGDWRVERVELLINPTYAKGSAEAIMAKVNSLRNVVDEMAAYLVAVKPARPRDEALLEPTAVRLMT